MQPQKAGEFHFYTASDDGVRLWVNHQVIIDDWNSHGVEINHGKIILEAEKKYNIKLEYFENIGGAEIKLGWIPPE